jgi:hypothetical protein
LYIFIINWSYAMNIDRRFAGTPRIATVRRSLSRSLAALALVSLSTVANGQTVLPLNANPNCTVSQVEFNNWFESGSVSINGGVLPADGLAFSPDPLNPFCSFYKWSQQMFLWLTSPVPSRYGSGSHVFDSPVFYAVSPPDPNNNDIRTLIPHSPGGITFSGNATSLTQRGSKGQAVVFDSTGKIHDVVRPEVGASGKLLARSKTTGQPVEIERIQAGRDGKPVLLDKSDKPVNFQAARSGAPLLHDRSGAVINLQGTTVLINGTPHLVTTSGGVVETEQGQAGGFVLMAQNGSLVYYLLQVNDVFAYFNTGVAKGSNGGIPGLISQFPSNAADLAQVTSFGLANSKTFPDANALTCEVKSSWIETAGLNVADYVTITATIPTFNPPLTPPFTQTGVLQAVPSGTKQATLAMVGMHVVCPVLGQPEMIWATFEHINNAPNAPYQYRVGSTTPSGPVGPGPWLFSSTGASSGLITARMKVDPVTGNIDRIGTQTIGPTDVYRKNAWGTASNNSAFINNNTDIISINNSVFGKLLPGDKRVNYFFEGATWTINGQPPSPTNQVGTIALANATMESYFQPSNCFSCHAGNMLGTAPSGAFGGGLSHIWFKMKQLFP